MRPTRAGIRVRTWVVLGGVAAVVGFSAFPAAAQPVGAAGTTDPALAPPANVAVSDIGQPVAFYGPTPAIDPTNPDHIVIAYGEEQQQANCYLGVSYNDGATWRDMKLVGPGARVALPAGGNQCYWPTATFGPDGTLYYAFSDHVVLSAGTGFIHGHFFLYSITSTDGGTNFSAPVTVDTQPPVPASSGGGDFIPLLTTDPASGRLYATWEVQNFSQPAPLPPMATFSTDHGRSFAAPVLLDTAANGGGAFPSPSVGAGGRLYISFDNFTPPGAPKGVSYLQVVSSTNGGVSYSAPVTATSGYGCYPPPPGGSCSKPMGRIDDAGALGEAVAAPTQGLVYAATQAVVGNSYRIQVAVSHDYGATWRAQRTIAIPPGLAADSQIFPNIAVAPNGRVDIVYYDFTVPGGVETTYLSSSTDGGNSFSTPRLISDAPSSIFVGSGFGVANGSFGGGRLVTSTDGATFTAWTDTRRGNHTNGQNDVYSARVQLAPRGYRMVASDGGIFDFGDSAYYGSEGGLHLNQPVVG
ncbi:MAG TPA: sialidase family protein, partial [Acidimicrobiales bacterium]|nr:sialidase family protein [Acidimicrobiales bacterium]